MLKSKYKILLINPGFEFESGNFYLMEPIGLLYISSYLKKKLSDSVDVNIIDAVSETGVKKKINHYQYGLTIHEIADKVNEINPDMVGLTNMFSMRKSEMFRLAEIIKKKNKEIKITVGGIYPTIFPELTLKSEYIDYLIIGEGEESFAQLIKNIINNSPLNNIDGIGYKQNKNIVINPKSIFINNLDEIPFPDRESINFNFYNNYKMKLYGLGFKRKASIITSRSCPNRCSFCSMYLSHGPKWRSRSAENVVDEILYLKKHFLIDELFVMDDNFSFDKNRTIQICEKIIKQNIKIKWNTPNGLSAKTLDLETLQIMKKSGCHRICIAIESGDSYIRNKIIGKGISDEKIKEVVENANKAGLSIFAYYIIGMPGETEESFNKTISQIKELKLNGVATSFATPLAGTKLFDECVKNNYFIKNELCDSKFNIPIIETPDFNRADLIRREKIFYFEFLKAHFFKIIIDAFLKKNDLLNFTFLKRIFYDKLLKFK
ncbi:radical SAM protein [Candidatus Dependentiae bacterium]|nr:radical SAM protein [Candidatus Dependentiae bacterium]